MTTRFYLDTAQVIYTVENVPYDAEIVDAKLSAADITLVTSDLTRLECRVKPLRDRNTALLQDYEDYFSGAIQEIVPLSRVVIDRATDIHAQYGFRTPDAIHLAAALVAGCDVFLTNDHRLNRFTALAVEVIQR